MRNPLAPVCTTLGLVLLAGCETTPNPGETVTAQVVAVPLSRADLRGGHGHLHAALRAGVTRRDAEGGRLVRGECGEPDPKQRDGVRWHVATTVLPEGAPSAPGTLVDIGDLVDAPGAATRRHGSFVSLAPPLDAESAIRSAHGAGLHTPCRPKDLPSGRMRIQLRGAVPPWQLDFAGPELARHDRFSDAELAAGRVVMLACQLKVADGGDWYRPVWLARAPDGMRLRTGDVVRLRTGALENSKDIEPMAQVLGPEPARSAPGGNDVVRCR